jgi:hypothetical protein
MNGDILSQASQIAQDASALARAQDVRAYIHALDIGDFDAMSEIAERAMNDPILEEALFQADLEMAKDEIVPPEELERATKIVKHIFKQYNEEW